MTSSQSSLAYEKIKEMIFKMELLPGARIPELQIAEILSVSRTPIHDALRKLESEGLVLTAHNRGAEVVSFTPEQIKAIGTVRLAQDILAAELASYYGSAADFERLEKIAAECQKAAAKGDIYNRIQLDSDFHLEITRIAGNPVLLSQQEALYQQIHLIQIIQYTGVTQSLKQIGHHQPLIGALRSGDRKQIRRLICDHIKDFYHLDPYVLKCFES